MLGGFVMIFGLTIEQLCDWLILISAAGVAVVKIYGWFKAPFKWGKKRQQQAKEEQRKEICKILDEEMPNRFLENNLETRQKYLADRTAYLNEIKEEILKQMKEDFLVEIKKELEDIKKINIEQTEQISTIRQGSKDMLRQRIMMIYHSCKNSKKISIYDREALDEAYKDYKAEGGNSYIDKYYTRTLNWETYYPDCEED